MRLLTKVLVGVWIFLLAAVAAARVGNVGALQPLSSAFLADGTVTSPASIVGFLTLAFVIVAWRIEVGARKREEAAILRDKPGLAGDHAALTRERRIRRKELQLQKAEEKALRKETHLQRTEMRAVDTEKRMQRDEKVIEQRREMLRAKREELRDREALGR